MSAPCETCGSVFCGDICSDLPLEDQLERTQEEVEKYRKRWLEYYKECNRLKKENEALKALLEQSQTDETKRGE